MPGADDQESQLAVQRLATTFAELPIAKDNSSLLMHAGLATAPDDGLSYEELLELAQQELTQRPIVPAQPDPQQIAGTNGLKRAAILPPTRLGGVGS